jgi:beta-hydroxylase
MKWLIIGTYLVSVMCVHCRGRLRLPLRQQLLDRSTLLAPINLFMYLFSKAPTPPFVASDALPELAPLRAHWRSILAEAERLKTLGDSGVLAGNWKDIYLKWYDSAHPAARELCPATHALLQAIPSVRLASFIELPAGASVPRHRDPYAGWLRYHLGLATPNDDACYMKVDGRRYVWRDGHAMLFDETYVHWADNGSGRSRLLLLCDVERPMRFRWAQAVNHWCGRMLAAGMNAPSPAGGTPGRSGILFRALRGLGRYRRSLRARSMAAYRAAVVVSLAGFAVLLYLA